MSTDQKAPPTADPRKIPFDLPGFLRPRTLRFEVNAFGDAEQMLGMTMLHVMTTNQLMGFNTVKILLWAGLRHEDMQLTPKRVGNMMTRHMYEHGGKLATLVEKVAEGIAASGLFPKLGEDEEDPQDQRTQEEDEADPNAQTPVADPPGQ